MRPAISLTRQHYKRLRWYFGRSSGAASRADNADLDLCAMGLIERVDSFGVVYFKIAPSGAMELSAENQREIARRKPHHTLAENFAQWLRGEGKKV